MTRFFNKLFMCCWLCGLFNGCGSSDRQLDTSNSAATEVSQEGALRPQSADQSSAQNNSAVQRGGVPGAQVQLDQIRKTAQSVHMSGERDANQIAAEKETLAGIRALKFNLETEQSKRECGRQLGGLLQQSCRDHLVQDVDDETFFWNEYRLEILARIADLQSSAVEAVPVLAEVMGQIEVPDDLKLRIIEMIPQLGTASRQLVPALALASRESKFQNASIKALLRLHSEESASIAALGLALRNPKLRTESLAELGQIEGQAAIPASRFLFELATSPDLDVQTRLAAIQIIGKFSRTGIAELWSDPNPLIRKAAAKIGIADGNLLVIEKDPEVLAAAFEGLANPPIKATHLAGIFNQALKQESLRPTVGQFLSKHPEQVVEILLKLFKSDSAMIREYSVELFAELESSPIIVDTLSAVLDDSDDLGIQTLAAIKLGEVIPDVDRVLLASSVGKWVSHAKLNRAALTLLEKLGPDAASTLVQTIADNRVDAEIKELILKILIAQPATRTIALPLLKEMLKSDDVSIQGWSAVVLTRLSSDDTAEFFSDVSPFLQKALNSTETPLVRFALEALRVRPKLGNALITDVLSTLKHAETKVRLSAVLTLGKIGGESKSSEIWEALKKTSTEDVDLEVQRQAAEIVKKYAD